jgi:hypothetical protein
MKFFNLNISLPKKIGTIAWGTAIFIAVGTLLTSQFLLTIPTYREALTPISEYEGVSGQISANMAVAEITLTLQGIEPSADIRILQNGVAVAYFSSQAVSIMAQNNALIEIDGTKTDTPFAVSISNFADTITFADDKTATQVNNNIAQLARFFVK